MKKLQIDTMKHSDWPEVADLIYVSTNQWYQKHRSMSIFTCDGADVRLFCEVYEALDPGCCLVARSPESNQIIGSCFYHPRPSHFSLGIMNVHPAAFGKGVARAQLGKVIELAEEHQLPIRLVSSAMNLDSFSLYSKAGFIPRQLFQDFVLSIPSKGMLELETAYCPSSTIRPATLADVVAMGELEYRVSGITRETDYRYFIENRSGIWHCSVIQSNDNREGEMVLRGWIASIAHPASNMIGPCIAQDDETTLALLKSEIDYRRGKTMVFLLPADRSALVQSAYRLGARNCELHVLQVRGSFAPSNGISLPTFMPETA